MVALMAPHGSYHRNLIHDASDMWKPIGYGSPGLSVARKSAKAGDDGTPHLGQVVAKSDGVDEFSGVLVAFRVKGVDMADASAHEKKNDRLGFRLKMGPQHGVLDFSSLRPDATQRHTEKTTSGTMEKMTSRNWFVRK